jgi:hypothetical protein
MTNNNLTLSPTCNGVLDYLENNPDDCHTVNRLTRVFKHYKSNWTTVNNCLVYLEDQGL